MAWLQRSRAMPRLLSSPQPWFPWKGEEGGKKNEFFDRICKKKNEVRFYRSLHLSLGISCLGEQRGGQVHSDPRELPWFPWRLLLGTVLLHWTSQSLPRLYFCALISACTAKKTKKPHILSPKKKNLQTPTANHLKTYAGILFTLSKFRSPPLSWSNSSNLHKNEPASCGTDATSVLIRINWNL